MAASAGDAHPYPIYNARYRVIFPILDADGDLVTGAAGLDSELSQDTGTFADATNEATEIATSSGMYYLDLIATELDTKSTAIIVKTSTSGAKTTPMILYPQRLPVIRTGTAQAGAGSTITLDSGASDLDNFYNGCFVNITNNSPANALGQARRIVSYVGSTKVATIEGTWGTNPSSASTFEILATPESANLVSIGGTSIGMTDGATLRLKTLEIDNSTGNGMSINSIGSDGHGISVFGNGSGEGITAVGGATGHGASFLGGATSGHGIVANGQTDGHGILAAGAGARDGIRGEGGTSGDGGHGLGVVGGGSTGDGINASSASSDPIVGNIVGNLSGSVGSVSGNVGGNVTGSVGSLAAQAKTDVNNEVLDVLNTDTFAEPGQEAPGATISLARKIGYLYKAFRNRLTQTATEMNLYNDDATTVAQKATVSDNGTTYDRGEIGSGP